MIAKRHPLHLDVTAEILGWPVTFIGMNPSYYQGTRLNGVPLFIKLNHMNPKKFLSGSILALTMLLMSTLIAPAGDRTTETRNPGSFTGASFAGVYKVTLVQGSACSVKLEGEAADLSSVIAKVDGTTLEVSMKNNTRLNSEVFVTVTYVSLHDIEISGVVSVTATQPIQADRFEMDFSGIGNADLSIQATTLKLDISGTGNVIIKGTAKSANVDISGAGKLQAPGLQVEKYDLDISGAGNADISVSQNLDAEISGTGTITYQGSPAITQEISGMGRIVKK